MHPSEVDALHSQLLTLKGQLEEWSIRARVIAQRVADARVVGPPIPRDELSTLLAELTEHRDAIAQCAFDAVDVYEKLRPFGVASADMDEWCRKVAKDFGPVA